MLRDVDELTVEEKVEAVAAQVKDEDPILKISEHLGCEATVDGVAAELARIVELTSAMEGIAEELGLNAQESAEGSHYLEGVKELTARVEQLEEEAALGRVVAEAFDLDRLSVHLVANSSDPTEVLRREAGVSRAQLTLALPLLKPSPSLAERLAFHLGVRPDVDSDV